ncbi:MAG: 30S ribosomal protein S27e [Nanobdellota archaeon]
MASFVKIRCENCKKEQVIYMNASTPVKCLICGEEVAKPTGGKAKILAKIIKED